MLRYNFILAKTKNAQGDFLRTQSGAANQMRIFTETAKEAGINFGQLLLPMFTKGLTVVNDLANKFAMLDDDTKRLILSTGVLISSFGLALKGASLAMNMFAGMSGTLGNLITFTKASTKAMTAWNLATKMSVVGALVVGIAAAVKVYKAFNKELEKTKLNLKNTNVAVIKEQKEAGKLFGVIRDVAAAYTDRKEALDTLKERYPKYLENIDVENDGGDW